MEIGEITINQDIIQRSLDALRKASVILSKMDEANFMVENLDNTKEIEYSTFVKELLETVKELEEKFTEAVLKDDEINPESNQ